MQGLRWVSRGFEDRPVWSLRWCLLIFWFSTFHAHVIETKGTIHRQMGHICGMIDWSFHKGELDFQTRNPPQPLETGQLLQPLWRIQRSVYISFASTARAASLLMVKKRRWLERGKDLESMKNHEFYGVRGLYCQISLLKGRCQSWWKKILERLCKNGKWDAFETPFRLLQMWWCGSYLSPIWHWVCFVSGVFGFVVDNNIGGFGTGDDVCPY